MPPHQYFYRDTISRRIANQSYLPLDINPVFPCLGEIMINIIIIIIIIIMMMMMMMIIIIIIIIFSIVLTLQNSKNFIFFVVQQELAQNVQWLGHDCTVLLFWLL